MIVKLKYRKAWKFSRSWFSRHKRWKKKYQNQYQYKLILNLPSMVSLPPEHVMCRCIRPRLSVWSHPHRFGTLSSHLLCTFMSHATSSDHYRLYQHRLWLVFLFLFIAIRSILRAINFRRDRSCHSRLKLWTEGRGSRFVRHFWNIRKSAHPMF